MSKSGPSKDRRRLKVALAGNPNSGKSSIFNNLTGSHQHVGNYPGVTVEHKEGTLRTRDGVARVVDLPGTYSLTAYSMEEVITRDYIVQEAPDVVVDVVDAGNLERNLYLTVQLMELGRPMVMALNMHDLAEQQGVRIDSEKLSKLLGMAIVPTVGHRNIGTEKLGEAIFAAAEQREEAGLVQVSYGTELEREIEKIRAKLGEPLGGPRARWTAIKLLEGDEEVGKLPGVGPEETEKIREEVAKSALRLKSILGEDPETLIADARYGFISGACQEAVVSTAERRHNVSEQVDAILTHRVLAFPIFLGMMWLVFQLTFTVGRPFMTVLEMLFDLLAREAAHVLPARALQSLVVDGIIHGVGGVLVFVPNIVLLFLAIAVLEDSGYMSRAAFIMDRLMHKIGLHGKSFIPMLLGFGCTVPAVMATRTLESRRDRIITIMVTPLMSCGARFPVYVLLAGAFFPQHEGNVIFSIYLLGVVLALVMAKVFGKYLMPGMSAPFVMELPPYRVPTAKGVVIHTWERTWMYLKKAGTVILGFSILIWGLSKFPQDRAMEASYETKIAAADSETTAAELKQQLDQEKLQYSCVGRLGRAIAPLLKPVGLGDWKVGTALMAGLGAKEVVVSTMGTLYSLGESGQSERSELQTRLRADPFFSGLVAYVLMVFVLIYVPCMATVAVVKGETGSWVWPAFLVGYTTTLAWVVAGIIYWGGRLLGF